jgi:hypothetical protein
MDQKTKYREEYSAKNYRKIEKLIFPWNGVHTTQDNGQGPWNGVHTTRQQNFIEFDLFVLLHNIYIPRRLFNTEQDEYTDVDEPFLGWFTCRAWFGNVCWWRLARFTWIFLVDLLRLLEPSLLIYLTLMNDELSWLFTWPWWTIGWFTWPWWTMSWLLPPHPSSVKVLDDTIGGVLLEDEFCHWIHVPARESWVGRVHRGDAQ